MQRSREDLTKKASATAPENASVNLDLSGSDIETLLKLQEAGLIDLDGINRLGEDDPKHVEWTYPGFRKHMVADQSLALSTAENRIRYVRFLEEHEDLPVDLRPPNEDSYLEHIYERRASGAPGTTLNHYRKATKSLLKFLGIDVWDSLKSEFPEPTPTWHLPPDGEVSRFWQDEDAYGVKDPYLRSMYAHVFHFGFHTGVRPPSEICALDIDDVDFDARRVTITEKKKGGKRRDLEPVEEFVISATYSKSLKNYLDHHRPKVDRGKTDAFFLNAHGERPAPMKFRQHLSRIGKRIWPQFKPYTMRRWFATQLLIATDFNIYVVAQRLGDTVQTVEDHYLDKAKALSKIGEEYQIPRFCRGVSSEG